MQSIFLSKDIIKLVGYAPLKATIKVFSMHQCVYSVHCSTRNTTEKRRTKMSYEYGATAEYPIHSQYILIFFEYI